MTRRSRQPLGDGRAAASDIVRNVGGYFMEEVRRDLIARYGENADDRPEQRLCRRPVGPHLLRSGDAATRPRPRCATA